jgi:hypothetical protein
MKQRLGRVPLGPARCSHHEHSRKVAREDNAEPVAGPTRISAKNLLSQIANIVAALADTLVFDRISGASAVPEPAAQRSSAASSGCIG